MTAHGNTSNVSAEFNIYHDPEAAHVVFEAWENYGGLIELIDWEATMRHGIPEEVIQRWHALDTPKSRFYEAVSARTMEFIRQYLGRTMMFGADPLAMAVALEPDIVTKAEVRHVSVELTGMYTRGQTTTDWGQRNGRTANTNIILELDTDRFHALMEQGLK